MHSPIGVALMYLRTWRAETIKESSAANRHRAWIYAPTGRSVTELAGDMGRILNREVGRGVWSEPFFPLCRRGYFANGPQPSRV
jgi:hypothetical protein